MSIKHTIKIITLFFLAISISFAATKKIPTQTAIFAGGCFWCVQADFDKLDGVEKTIVGYTGGHTSNPTYQQVSKENTGHVEAVKVFYNPKIINYQALLTHFWHNVDPTDAQGQFCDKGPSYKAVIFYENSKQKQLAEASKKKLQKRFKHIAVTIRPASTFYKAENYHQNYYKKNPLRYRFYRFTCGRDKRLKQVWQGSKN